MAVARARDAVMVEVNDAFCALVGRRRDLDWLIDRFPGPGTSHRRRRVFETRAGRRLADLDLHGVEIGGERLIVAVIVPVEATVEEQDLLSAFLDAAPQGIVVYDRNLRIVRLNRSAERAGNIHPGHVGRLLREVVPDAPPATITAQDREDRQQVRPAVHHRQPVCRPPARRGRTRLDGADSPLLRIPVTAKRAHPIAAARR